MGSSDRLDTALAKYFAWCSVPPGGMVDVAERLRRAREDQAAYGEPSGLVSPAQPVDAELRAERAVSLCSDLAGAVADAWALIDVEASLVATRRLLSRADRLGPDVYAMEAHPTEAVRLLRLLVRHGAKLTRRQRERAAALTERMPLAHPEVIELFVEVARGGDRTIAHALLSDEDAEFGDEGLLVARLVDVLDAASTHASRALAIDVLRRVKSRQAATASLRRALHLPSFAVRARALHALSRPCGRLHRPPSRLLRQARVR